MKVKKMTTKQTVRNGKKPVASKSNGNKAAAKKCNGGRRPAKTDRATGIKKQYLKNGRMCNVTFRLPKEAAPDARAITVVGDFNSWNLKDTPMTRLKSGDFKVTMKLPRGKEYKFRYFIDSQRWENDWQADDYVPNAYGCDDSLVKV